MIDPNSFRPAGVIGWPIIPVALARDPHLVDAETRHPQRLPADGGAARPAGAALRGLAALGFAGCNVTIPHKERAAELVDTIDALARRAGAVNLVVVRPTDRSSGSNKDGFGFIEAVREDSPNWRADAGPAVVLGAGGAARSVVVALLDEGATRDPAGQPHPRPHRTACRQLRRPAARAGLGRAQVGLGGAALLVNTTSQGIDRQARARPAPGRAAARARWSATSSIIRLKRPLLAAARARGNPAVNGLGMLLHQARPAFEAWFGVFPEVTPELRAAIEMTLR